MSDTPRDKPAKELDESFRELVTQWERNFDAFANQFMGTENFSRGMNQAQDAQLAFRKMIQDFMGRSLENVNMPSREDLVRVAESVQNIDRRLARIEDMLSSMLSNASLPPEHNGPPRTRKPPSSGGDV
jgi:hypothetical protein